MPSTVYLVHPVYFQRQLQIQVFSKEQKETQIISKQLSSSIMDVLLRHLYTSMLNCLR